MMLNFETVDQSIKMQNIVQCLTNLLSIPSGSIPLSRGMGLEWANLSNVPESLENDIATDIIAKVDEYEPRVQVSEVTFNHDASGISTVNILIERGEEFGD